MFEINPTSIHLSRSTTGWINRDATHSLHKGPERKARQRGRNLRRHHRLRHDHGRFLSRTARGTGRSRTGDRGTVDGRFPTRTRRCDRIGRRTADRVFGPASRRSGSGGGRPLINSGSEPTDDWRIVDDGIHDEPTHLALDEVLTERLDNDEMVPTIRFWYRDGVAVPFGRFQAYADEVEAEYVDEHDIDVVRRITGGGAMYAEPGAVITYSMYLPRESVPDDVEDSYERLDRWAIDALRDLGLAATHEPLNDIVHEDGKI